MKHQPYNLCIPTICKISFIIVLRKEQAASIKADTINQHYTNSFTWQRPSHSPSLPLYIQAVAPMRTVSKLSFVRALSWPIPMKDPNHPHERSKPSTSLKIHIYHLTNKISSHLNNIYPCIGWFVFLQVTYCLKLHKLWVNNVRLT